MKRLAVAYVGAADGADELGEAVGDCDEITDGDNVGSELDGITDGAIVGKVV